MSEQKQENDVSKPAVAADARPQAAAPRRAPVPNSRNYNPPEPEDPKGGGAPLMSKDYHGIPPAVAVNSAALVADNTVLMFFPKEVRICLPNHAVVTFPEGVNKVPAELADHWYFKVNGVKRA